MARINIFINEICQNVDRNITAYEVKEKYKKDCDLLILNGFPIEKDIVLNENDKVILIKKGEKPSYEELENLLIARHTPNIHEKLKKGKVAILGLGGLGSNIAISLARIGVGELILVDYDIVEPSNLNRQQYYIDDIGKYKSEALKDNIYRINPFVKLVTYNMVVSKDNINTFDDVDIIIEAFDNPVSKAKICNSILSKMKEKYLIASSGMAGYYDSNTIITKKIKEKFYICGDFVSEAQIGDGLMAPRVAICANHMANLATRILIEKL